MRAGQEWLIGAGVAEQPVVWTMGGKGARATRSWGQRSPDELAVGSNRRFFPKQEFNSPFMDPLGLGTCERASILEVGCDVQ